jgi:UDP-3-O-[3-hydroxymyristoyl] glucosamine N-acyltransferase
VNGENAEGLFLSLGEIAAAIGGTVEGDPELPIGGVCGIEDAAPGTIVRVEHLRYLEAAISSPASALLTDRSLGPVTKACIRVDNVRLAFARCLELFSSEELPAPGVDPTAVIGAGTELGEDCSIGAYVVLGRRVRLGAGVILHPHVILGDDVEVGAGSVLYPRVVLYPKTVLGSRVRIHAGAVIGADGYGYVWTGERHHRIPQIGRVRIGDDVEVGANTTIDRATTGETVIGAGTKIDNLVQIAHNVQTGEHCLIIAQVGIAGSARLGSGVVLAGQAGIKDHVTIDDGAQVGGGAAVWGDQKAGAVISGQPARPHREEIRIQAALGQLPELLRRVRELERRLEDLRVQGSGFRVQEEKPTQP